MTSIQTRLSIWALAIVALAALALMTLQHQAAPTPSTMTPYRPVFVVLVVAIAAVYSMVVRTITSPVRHLSELMRRFGAGDLSVRAQTHRSDDIGQAARVFNGMADRIELLVAAERRLLRDVSHELRAPLARLRFAAELVKDSADQQAALERLVRETDRLTALVDSLLQMARAEADGAAVGATPVRLDELLHAIVADCDPFLRHITLEGDAIVVVVGDAELLRRAIENVITNALRYGQAKPIHVSLTCRNRSARLTVRDFGPGVPESAVSEIFRPFYRVDDARARDGGGTGLGLAIAQRAVELHGGRISAENVTPGLLVTIELPTNPLSAGAGGVSESGTGL